MATPPILPGADPPLPPVPITGGGLLLTRAHARHRNGLANSSGLVGLSLMLRLWGIATGVFEEPLQSWQGQSGSWIGSWQCYEFDERRGFVGTSNRMTQPTYGPLANVFPGPGPGPGPGLGVRGADHHARVAGMLGHSVTWAMTGGDLPSEALRVELSPTVRDSSGLAARALAPLPHGTTATPWRRRPYGVRGFPASG